MKNIVIFLMSIGLLTSCGSNIPGTYIRTKDGLRVKVVQYKGSGIGTTEYRAFVTEPGTSIWNIDNPKFTIYDTKGVTSENNIVYDGINYYGTADGNISNEKAEIEINEEFTVLIIRGETDGTPSIYNKEKQKEK